MKFQARIDYGEGPELEKFDLDLRPATLESARIYLEAHIDEFNRENPKGPKQILIDVELQEEFKKAG